MSTPANPDALFTVRVSYLLYIGHWIGALFLLGLTLALAAFFYLLEWWLPLVGAVAGTAAALQCIPWRFRPGQIILALTPSTLEFRGQTYQRHEIKKVQLRRRGSDRSRSYYLEIYTTRYQVLQLRHRCLTHHSYTIHQRIQDWQAGTL